MERFGHIIIGGGAVGTSALFQLAKRGASRLLLLEKLGGFGRGATGIWGSLVRMFYHNLETTRAATKSLPIFLNFEKNTGTPFNWQQTGSLYFLKRSDLPIYQGHLAALTESGLKFAIIEPDQGKSQFPDFAWFEDDVAVYEPNAGVASPGHTTEAFLAEAKRRGATARVGTPVIEILTAGNRAVGVRTADNSCIECDMLIVCAGIWTNNLLSSIKSSVDAYTVPIQLNRYACHPEHHSHQFFIDLASGTFGHPTIHGSFIGGYLQDEQPSLDLNLTHLCPSEANRAKQEIARRIPWLKSASLEGGIRALESYTEDRHGLVERLSGFENIIVSTGWSCAGFTLSPEIGSRIADISLDV